MQKYRNRVIIVIPTYNPENSFVSFVSSLLSLSKLQSVHSVRYGTVQYSRENNTHIIVIDDGNGSNFSRLFDELAFMAGVVVLHHAVNLGKGRSLKTAFNYVLSHYPNAIGVVTADADGQHKVNDIMAVYNALLENPESLILGCRDLKGDRRVPWKSRIGNNLTRLICSFLCGIHVSDTQTGLRGIPISLVREFMNTPGERYEFETNMLLEVGNASKASKTGGLNGIDIDMGSDKISIIEVPISTVYYDENRNTHFDPIRDSLMIYRTILAYSFSSILATVTDFLIFSYSLWIGHNVWFSTAIARLSGALVNFLFNKKAVFKSDRNGINGLFELVKYVALVIFSGTVSALSVSCLAELFPRAGRHLVLLKAIVEFCLFFFNYYVQRTFIFAKGRSIFHTMTGNMATNTERLVENELVTNWTRYYQHGRSWFSTFTQRFTLKRIIAAINDWLESRGGG